MATILATAGALATVVAGLVALLRLANAAGKRLARTDAGQAPPRLRPAVAPGPGYLNDEEQSIVEWETEANRRDLERLAAAHRVFEHGMNRLFERALAQLKLTGADQNWARVATGGDPMGGIR